MLAQEEGVCLGACQPGAVNPGLLSGAHAHGLAVIGKADGVGLGIFQGNQRHDQVDFGGLGQIFVLGDNVTQQVGVDLEIVSSLLEGDAENLLGLLLGGDIARVNGHHVVAALALGFEDSQCFLGIARGNDAVGNLPGDELRRGHVTHIGKSHPVAEGAHPVGAPGTGVGAGQGAVVQLRHIVYKAGLFQAVGQGLAYGGGGGGDVLEGGDGCHAGGLLQFLHQLPGVQGIQEIDVAGTAVEDGDGQVGAVRHVDGGRLLVGVAAVFQRKFFHFVPSRCLLRILC